MALSNVDVVGDLGLEIGLGPGQNDVDDRRVVGLGVELDVLGRGEVPDVTDGGRGDGQGEGGGAEGGERQEETHFAGCFLGSWKIQRYDEDAFEE